KYLSPLFASLRNQTYKDWQLLIWDNGSTDGTAGLIEKELSDGWCQYEITKSDKNIGFASAHNRLFISSFKFQASSYVLVLNQDTVLEPDYIEKLVNFLDQHPEAGSVTGRIMKLNDRQKIDSMGLKLLITSQIEEIIDGDKENPFAVFGVSGALPVYRITAIKRVGFFDEDFFSYKEDVDLAYRLRRAGFKAYCVPRATAYHDRSAGADGGLVRAAQEHHNRSELINFYSYRNHIFVLIKNLDRRDFWRLPFIFIYELGKFFYLLILEPKVLSKAWADIWRLAPKMIKKRHI
ncbi:MAG: glycosyltransferase family 2 protein, partial [Patescibacteria group bacterium]